ATQRADVVETTFLDSKIEIAGVCLTGGPYVRLLGNHDLVEPWRHRVDKLHVVDELGVALLGHAGADKNGQMASLRINGVKDPLPAPSDLLDALVIVENPVQSFLRRCDVVSVRAEADDWRLDLANIKANAVASDDLASREFVRNKEIVDHPLHL